MICPVLIPTIKFTNYQKFSLLPFFYVLFILHSGLPPTSLTADKTYIYWSNETLGKVYSISKETRSPKSRIMGEICDFLHQNPVVTEEIRGIRSIRAIGNHLQPYPDASCLLFESYKNKAVLEEKSPTSLKLHLPPMHRPKHCSRMSFPSVQYTVFYGPSENHSAASCYYGGACKSMVRFYDFTFLVIILRILFEPNSHLTRFEC